MSVFYKGTEPKREDPTQEEIDARKEAGEKPFDWEFEFEEKWEEKWYKGDKHYDFRIGNEVKTFIKEKLQEKEEKDMHAWEVMNKVNHEIEEVKSGGSDSNPLLVCKKCDSIVLKATAYDPETKKGVIEQDYSLLETRKPRDPDKKSIKAIQVVSTSDGLSFRDIDGVFYVSINEYNDRKIRKIREDEKKKNMESWEVMNKVNHDNAVKAIKAEREKIKQNIGLLRQYINELPEGTLITNDIITNILFK